MKFTLREVFLAILVLALTLGWLLDRTALRRELSNYMALAGALELVLRDKRPATHIDVKIDNNGIEQTFTFGPD